MKLTEKCGFPEITQFHVLRHTYTTQLIKACKDLSVVQQQLGHADIRTTMRYSNVTEERKRNAVELLDFGLQENGTVRFVTNGININIINFQGGALLYFTIGMFLSIFFGYNLIRKGLNSLENFQISGLTLKNSQLLLILFLLLDYLFLQIVLLHV